MIEVNDKKDCCGCWACENVCPKGCITMQEDAEGFRYPVVDAGTCIDCHLCENVCPVIKAEKEEVNDRQKGFLLQNKDERVLMESTSGGAFTAIASLVIQRGGIVYGAALNGNNEAVHVGVDKVENLRIYRNSKYVQSLVGNTFTEAKKFLDEGRLVCFSGTPCQLEGLMRYLRKPYANLITVDVVCRAVPSPKVLRKYVEFQEGRYGGNIRNLVFRSKRFHGYKYSNMSFEGDKGSYHAGIDTDPWLRSFFAGINVRPSCFACRFKKRYRMTDVTIWDCFEVWKYDASMDNDMGVTRVLAHTPKGERLMHDIAPWAKVREMDADVISRGVLQMQIPEKESLRRTAFFEDLDNMSAGDVFGKYFPVKLKNRMEHIVRMVMLRMGLYKLLKKTAVLIFGEMKRG